MLTFFTMYVLCIFSLIVIKAIFSYPNYIIPKKEIIFSSVINSDRYLYALCSTMAISLTSHIISIVLSAIVGTTIVFSRKVGGVIKNVAYMSQVFPVIAVAPVVFILFGSNNVVSRLLISIIISYFPLLLTVTGSLSKNCDSIEHFYKTTQSVTWTLLFRIRITENMQAIRDGITGSGVLAIVGSVVAGFLSAQSGIGHELSVALNKNHLEDILAAIFILGIGSWSYLSFLELLLTSIEIVIYK